MTITRRCLVFAAAGCLGLASTVLGTEAASAAQTASQLKVLSYNVYGGGASMADSVKQANPDVVALVESSDARTKELADALGWYATSSGSKVNLISKQPIQDTWTSGDLIAGAKVDGTWVYSAHLDYQPYGPYTACFDQAPTADVIAGESGRKAQAEQITSEIESSTPTILAGDFNAPSHNDWTSATANQHCGYTVEWPASKAVADAGYYDSYREVHPDPAADPGNTWSPKNKTNENGQPEPQDRIDYIYYKGGSLDATDSQVYGTDSSWPSDHSAVLTTFSQ